MKTIVAAIDFSDVSDLVLEQTASLAKATGAKVHLLHVVEEMAAFYDIYGYTVPNMPDFEQYAKQRAEGKMQEQCDKLGLEAGVAEGHILEGKATHAIMEFAKQHEADLLVLGTHGHGFLGRVLLGSTAERVMRHSHLPTLLVPVQED